MEQADAATAGKGVRHLTIEGSTLPFSSCVQVGPMLLLSGQIGIDAHGRLAPDLPSQVAVMMANIREALALAGGDLHHIVKCTVMLRDMAQWPAFNAAYLPFFAPGRLPARSAFGGVELAFGAEVEMECIAYLC
jgi:enamine deaminase RidA (YjgF/YER057c/UK114 family)